MSDLISRSASLKDIEYYISHTSEESGEHYAYKQCKKLIERQPPVEPARGEWIVQDEGRTKFMCSQCGGKNHGGHEKYCPNCGADMRKKV